jgi:hypothetical protein
MPKPIENEFSALRSRARAKRDRAIAEARQEYEAALVEIAGLEQRLCGKLPKGYKTIVQAIDAVIPREGTFTTLDVMTGLEAFDPKRNWRKRSVDYVLTRMRQRGAIRRLKRATIHERASYVRAEAGTKAPGTGDMTLMQIIGKVLVRPMTTTDVVVAVLEMGYETAMGRNNLRNHATRVLKQGGFKCEGGRWLP